MAVSAGLLDARMGPQGEELGEKEVGGGSGPSCSTSDTDGFYQKVHKLLEVSTWGAHRGGPTSVSFLES